MAMPDGRLCYMDDGGVVTLPGGIANLDGSEGGAEAADPRSRRRLRFARAKRAEVIHCALYRLRYQPLNLDGATRLGGAKRATGACAC
jgi:hypothetical protein